MSTPIRATLTVLGLALVALPGGASGPDASPAKQSEIDSQYVQAPTPARMGIIDGATNPDDIPDELAYRLVFLAMAEPENPKPEERARASAKMLKAGLDEADRDRLLIRLGKLWTMMASIKTERERIIARDPQPDPSSADARRIEQLANQEKAVMAKTLSDLPSYLTSDGLARFSAFVREAKCHMKVIQGDRMSKTATESVHCSQ